VSVWAQVFRHGAFFSGAASDRTVDRKIAALSGPYGCARPQLSLVNRHTTAGATLFLL
jgi:hypothetical protein